MNEWEAKYKALAAGIDDPKLVENAEKLVSAALDRALHSTLPFSIVFHTMLQAVHGFRDKPSAGKEFFSERTFERPTVLGIPVNFAEWMPKHYTAISNEKDLFITDLRTGKVKRVTKEDMERLVGGFFAEK